MFSVGLSGILIIIFFVGLLDFTLSSLLLSNNLGGFTETFFLGLIGPSEWVLWRWGFSLVLFSLWLSLTFLWWFGGLLLGWLGSSFFSWFLLEISVGEWGSWVGIVLVSTGGLVVDVVVSDGSSSSSLSGVFILVGSVSSVGISLLSILSGNDLFGLSDSLSVRSVLGTEWVLSWLLKLNESGLWSSSPQFSVWIWLVPETTLSLGVSSSGDMTEQSSRGSFVSLISSVDIGLLPGFISLLGSDDLSLDWLVLDKRIIGISERSSWHGRSIITLELDERSFNWWKISIRSVKSSNISITDMSLKGVGLIGVAGVVGLDHASLVAFELLLLRDDFFSLGFSLNEGLISLT